MMAKLPTRIPSDQVKGTVGWPLQELTESEGSKTFLLKKPIQDQTQRSRRYHPSTAQAKNQPESSRASVVRQPDKVETQLSVESLPTEPPQQQPDVQDEPAITEEAVAQPIEVAAVAIEDVGYADGYKKGETEGYVKGEQTGYSAGLEAGTSEGRNTATEAFQEEVASQKNTLKNLLDAYSSPPSFEAELEQALTMLVTEIAKVVVMGELKSEPQHIGRLVNQALQSLPHQTRTPRVYFNPSDVEWVQANISADIEVVADASLAIGGCRVETQESNIDATLAQRIRAALTATFGEQTEQIDESDLQQIDTALDP